MDEPIVFDAKVATSRTQCPYKPGCHAWARWQQTFAMAQCLRDNAEAGWRARERVAKMGLTLHVRRRNTGESIRVWIREHEERRRDPVDELFAQVDREAEAREAEERRKMKPWEAEPLPTYSWGSHRAVPRAQWRGDAL